jgi:hypothetical protein
VPSCRKWNPVGAIRKAGAIALASKIPDFFHSVPSRFSVILRTFALPLVSLVLIPAASAELRMADRFDYTAASQPDPTGGLYRQNAPLTSEANRHIVGGRMVGFTEEFPWSGPSQLPAITAGTNGDPGSGRVAFRGNADDIDRVIFRRFTNESPKMVEYFGATLETNVIDPNGLVLVAFGEPTKDSQANGRAFLAGEGFTQGFAIGFRGNGKDGMNLVVRFRDENLSPMEQVLVEKVSQDVPYEVVCRVDWDQIPRGQSPRDCLTIWVNPGTSGEASEHSEFVATSGTAGTITMVSLLQRRFGENMEDAFYLDNLWLGDDFTDRPRAEK